MSVTHGQCDARPMDTFPACAGTKFILLGDRRTPKLWSTETLLSRDARRGSPQDICPSLHMCYHVKFGSSASKGVYINRMEPAKLGCAWAPPPCGRGVAHPPVEIRPSPTCNPAELGRSRSMYECYYGDPTLKHNRSHPAFQGHSRSSEPTRMNRHLRLNSN